MAIRKELKTVALLMFLLGFGVLLLGAISLSGTGATLLDFFKSLSVQFGFIVISVLAYSTSLFADKLLGIGKNKLFHIWTGIVIGFGYIFISGLIPGFSIAVPLLNLAISDNLKFLVIGIIAPVVESVAILGVLLGLLKTKFKPLTAIILTGLIASMYHLGSYLLNLYSYSFSQGLLGFGANISVFISAFIFFTFSGYLVNLKAYKGLLVSIVLHIVVNIFVYTKFAIIFAFVLGLL